MSKWKTHVRNALKDPSILAGISQIATEWMSEHISGNYGRGKSGQMVSHEPLKTVTGKFWTARKPRSGAEGQRVQQILVNGKTRYRREYLVSQTSFRAGGQPLRDTGALAGSLGATAVLNGSQIRLRMLGNKYGLYQDRGFTTRGPNYIPLTKKGRRQHGTGQNPNTEGLERGRDFLMAWRGVKVPARPFIMPTRDDLRSFGKSLYLGLRAILKRSV
jgi:hypothetical protein